jgi:hypothetical protein
MLEFLKKDWPQDLVDAMAAFKAADKQCFEARRRAYAIVENLTNAKRININPTHGHIYVVMESHAQQIARLSARIRELEAALRV